MVFTRDRAPAEQRVAAQDAFFLHVETPEVPQQVGGVVLLDVRGRSGDAPSLSAVRTLMTERLPELPRLNQRVRRHGPLRRARWVEAADIDMSWHVREVRLPAPGGRKALEDLAADLAAKHLDPDRPLWRMWLVRGVAPGEAAFIVLLHHAIADGVGVVDIMRQILEPRLPPASAVAPPGPGVLTRVFGGALGLFQLAGDGGAPMLSLTGPMGAQRSLRTVALPIADVRRLARGTGTRVTDVLLTLVGEVVSEVLHDRGEETSQRELRAAVPMSLRPPVPPDGGRSAVPGNLTAALRLDVPVDDRPIGERLAAVHQCAERRRRSGRALGSTAVMKGMGLVLPPPLHRRAARSIYRSQFFTAIVSNMPGPSTRLSFAGVPMRDVYPLLPLAEGVPLGVGALSWFDRFCLAVNAEPHLLPEVEGFAVRMGEAFERLQKAVEGTVEQDSSRTRTRARE